jgi:hypothetical protein
MALKDLLKRKEKKDVAEAGSSKIDEKHVDNTQFRITRSDTHGLQEILEAPTISVPEDKLDPDTTAPDRSSKLFSRLRSKSSVASSQGSPRSERRLSALLPSRTRSHESKHSSIYVPNHLPVIDDKQLGSDDKEAQWERRATMLAEENTVLTGNNSAEQLPSGSRNLEANHGPSSIRNPSISHSSIMEAHVRATDLHSIGRLLICLP